MENERAKWNEDRIDAFDGRFDTLEAGLHGFQRAMIAAMASVVIALIAQGFLPH